MQHAEHPDVPVAFTYSVASARLPNHQAAQPVSALTGPAGMPRSVLLLVGRSTSARACCSSCGARGGAGASARGSAAVSLPQCTDHIPRARMLVVAPDSYSHGDVLFLANPGVRVKDQKLHPCCASDLAGSSLLCAAQQRTGAELPLAATAAAAAAPADAAAAAAWPLAAAAAAAPAACIWRFFRHRSYAAAVALIGAEAISLV